MEQIPDVPVPEMVEQLVKLPKTVLGRNPDSADTGGSTVAIHEL